MPDSPYPPAQADVTPQTDVSEALAQSNDAPESQPSQPSREVGDSVVLTAEDGETLIAGIVTNVWTDDDGTQHVDAITFPHGQGMKAAFDVFREDSEG